MDQIRYSHKDFGVISENLFTFDGVVLEIFGFTQGSPSGVTQLNQRFHRDLMTIIIEEPDRKGARKVEIKAGGPEQYTFKVPEQDRPVIDFLERVRTALPTA